METELNEAKSSREKLQEELSSSQKEIQTVQGQIAQYREGTENLKRALEEEPRYRILLLLQDIKKATLTELSRTLAWPPAQTRSEIRKLEYSGWVKFEEDTVTIMKDFITI